MNGKSFRAPVVVQRWVFNAKYVMFILLGIAVFMTDPPTITQAFQDFVTPLWASGMVVTSAVALVGSLWEKWERSVERWGVTTIFILLVVYALAPVYFIVQGDIDRLAYSLIALTISLFPYARSIDLWGKADDK